MTTQAVRSILHVDMDAFFAAVEVRRKPELAGKPLIIGGEGDPGKRGVVSTASYEARKYGVHSATPLRTAYHLCPHAIFLPVDYKEYVRVSRQIKAVLRQFSPIMEDVGIDEAFLDLSHIAGEATRVGHEIKEAIHRVTGLTCSVGIAPNKLLAKIASDLQKPDGLTVLVEADIDSRIWPLAVRKLWGVGPKTEGRLKALGIHTIGELASRSIEDLVALFGPSYGHFLHLSSHGVDDRPLVTHWETKSLSRETTFEQDVRDWPTLSSTLAELSKESVTAMKREGLLCRTVTLKIRTEDFVTLSRCRTMEKATDSTDLIRRAAFECFNRADVKKKVRLIGVRLSSFTERDEAG